MVRVYLDRVTHLARAADAFHAVVEVIRGEGPEQERGACGAILAGVTHRAPKDQFVAIDAVFRFCESCRSDLATTIPAPVVLSESKKWRPFDA